LVVYLYPWVGLASRIIQSYVTLKQLFCLSPLKFLRLWTWNMRCDQVIGWQKRALINQFWHQSKFWSCLNTHPHTPPIRSLQIHKHKSFARVHTFKIKVWLLACHWKRSLKLLWRAINLFQLQIKTYNEALKNLKAKTCISASRSINLWSQNSVSWKAQLGQTLNTRVTPKSNTESIKKTN